jgi:hypothetical protein
VHVQHAVEGHHSLQRWGEGYTVEGICGIKDTYVVWKYVKKTVLELGFMGFIWVLYGFFRHLPGEALSTVTRWRLMVRGSRPSCSSMACMVPNSTVSNI